MNWFQRLLRRPQMEDQLDKELRFHIEQHANELIAGGADPAEARRRANLELGGREQVKERCRDARGTRWVEDLAQDARYALRMLRKNPGFAAVALLTLALGSGATTVMFTLVNGVLLKPLSYPEPDRLVQLHRKIEQLGEPWGYSVPDFHDYKRDASAVAQLAAWSWGGGTIIGITQAEYVDGREISSELFSVLGAPLARGRAFLPAEDEANGAPVAIISYRLWQRLYGGRDDAIGKQLQYDGKSRTIVGVAPAHFDPDGEIDGDADVFTPMAQDPDTRMANRSANFIHVIARLAPGVTLAQANAELSRIASHLATEYPADDAGMGAVAHPLQQDIVGQTRGTLWLLLGAVSAVLLIACVNVASLLLARAVSRERELAMRVALGAGRGRLVRQCLTESGILGLAGGLLGVLIAAAGIRPFLALWPGNLPRANDVQLDWRVLLVATGVSLLCGLLFGLAPALRAPTKELEQKLRGGMRTVGESSRRLHSGFVIAEIGLAVVLLVCAGMLGRTVLRLAMLDPGIRADHVLAARMAISPTVMENNESMRAAWMNALDRAKAVPGVKAAALTDIVPMSPGENNLRYWVTPAEPAANQMPLASSTSVTPDYPQVMGIALRRGRFFHDEDRDGHPLVVVVDEVLAQHAFGTVDVIGKRIHVPVFGADPVEIVGVVGHVRSGGLVGDDQARVRDQLYYPFAQVPDQLMRLFSTFLSLTVRASGPPLAMVEPLRRELRGSANDQVLYQVRTMEQRVSASLATQRFLLVLFGLFAGLALLLACIGIYGVMAYLTAQRVPEIGVRIALGASAGNVLWLVLRESVVMILAGVAIGTIAALAAARAMMHAVEGVRHVEPLSFAVMIPVLVTAALLASYVPARRASRIDPIRALRQE